jgi:aminoglycoside 3-N-acetyltransferase
VTESDTIAKTSRPATVESLANDLRTLGLGEGMTLLVHSSLSSLGWVAGGAQAVILALQAALSESGTLVMPAHSTANSEPSWWRSRPVPEDWWQTIRDSLPAFDPAATTTRRMGAIAELFRTSPGVVRSMHPQHSFAARGRHAGRVVEDHRLESPLGDSSPLARVYELNGHVLLLGVEHGNNTSLHLSEHRADWPGKRKQLQGAAMMVDGARQWVRFEQVHYDSEDFAQIGWDFVQTGKVKAGQVACAKAQLMRQRDVVDFGVDWIARNRQGSTA